ncbi:MAG TPA: rhomboid family intramembrane serine protease, partial [Solirubrobacterales bacterium]
MEATTQQQKTCYRHPNRETGVSCSNCGRPICPECMTSTPVGMRCPECARQTTKVRVGAGAFSPTAGKMPATIALIAINVIVFLIELAGGGTSSLNGGGQVIHDAGLRGPDIANGDWWRIITGGFLHAGFLHLLLNMYVLYVAGSILEPGIGTPRFLGIYFVSLVAGSLGALIVDPNTVTVGASGAIFGLMAGVIVVARGRGVEELASQFGLFVVLNLVLTFSIPGISIGG